MYDLSARLNRVDEVLVLECIVNPILTVYVTDKMIHYIHYTILYTLHTKMSWVKFCASANVVDPSMAHNIGHLPLPSQSCWPCLPSCCSRGAGFLVVSACCDPKNTWARGVARTPLGTLPRHWHMFLVSVARVSQAQHNFRAVREILPPVIPLHISHHIYQLGIFFNTAYVEGEGWRREWTRPCPSCLPGHTHSVVISQTACWARWRRLDWANSYIANLTNSIVCMDHINDHTGKPWVKLATAWALYPYYATIKNPSSAPVSNHIHTDYAEPTLLYKCDMTWGAYFFSKTSPLY